MSNKSIINEYISLKQSLEEKGLLSATRTQVFGRLFFVFLIFGLGLIIKDLNVFLSFLLMTIGGITLVWWIHDSGHDAYFLSKETSKWFIEFLGVLFIGMPQIEYHYEIHRRHHAFTNIIGRDGALATGPIIWHQKMRGRELPIFSKIQAAVWFLFVLPLTWLLITSQCLLILLKNRSFGRLAFYFSRWILFFWLLDQNLFLLFGPLFATGFVLGFAASLNHFHMRIDDNAIARFPQSVFLSTQNLTSKSFFSTWLTGGLNYHIEHHLFPTAPHFNLKDISKEVQDFALKQGLPYALNSPLFAVKEVVSTLQKAGREIKFPTDDHNLESLKDVIRTENHLNHQVENTL